MSRTVRPEAASTLERHTWEAAGRGVDVMLRDDGFAVVPGLGTAEDAAAARDALTLTAARLAESDRRTWRNPKGTCQVAWASRLAPGLAENPIREAARALAADIIGGRVVERFDYGLVTPPGGPGAPWHRDRESFVLPGVDGRVHVWVALQDIDESNGCLSYVPRWSDQDLVEEMAIACPTSAGTALVHDEETLHRSGSNDTSEPRWAWILQFAATSPVREAFFALDRVRAGLILGPTRRRLRGPRARPGTAASPEIP